MKSEEVKGAARRVVGVGDPHYPAVQGQGSNGVPAGGRGALGGRRHRGEEGAEPQQPAMRGNRGLQTGRREAECSPGTVDTTLVGRRVDGGLKRERKEQEGNRFSSGSIPPPLFP